MATKNDKILFNQAVRDVQSIITGVTNKTIMDIIAICENELSSRVEREEE